MDAIEATYYLLSSYKWSILRPQRTHKLHKNAHNRNELLRNCVVTSIPSIAASGHITKGQLFAVKPAGSIPWLLRRGSHFCLILQSIIVFVTVLRYAGRVHNGKTFWIYVIGVFVDVLWLLRLLSHLLQ